MEYTNITLLKNQHQGSVIRFDYFEFNLNQPCLFQFVTKRNLKTVSLAHYSVNIIDNFYKLRKPFQDKQSKLCLFPFYDLTPHCKWIPTAAFHEYSPKVIYQQIIKSNNQTYSYHKICHCTQNETIIINCSIDSLGPVHPGQTLQVELCTPCYDKNLPHYMQKSTAFIFLLLLVRLPLKLKL